MRKYFGVAALFFLLLQPAVATPQDEDENFLPLGNFPHVAMKTSGPPAPGSLTSEVKNLGSTVQETVKNFASFRDTTCFGDPCLFQAFPLVYTKPNSGFFGGVRAKLTNISREDPYLYSLEAGIIRSDTQQWETFLAGDFPQIWFLPLNPRLKIRGFYSRTTETRWYGTGARFDQVISRLDADYRYSSSELGANSSLIIPLFKIAKQKINAFGTAIRIQHNSKAFGAPSESKLINDSPRGIEGGSSSRFGFGLQLDSRDREILSRVGWELELAAEYSSRQYSQFEFKRFTIIDRRYFSKNRFTFANRISMDGLLGHEPFWELSSVGGIDPILDISDSQLMKGFTNGRFHERFKVINSSELRVELSPVRVFGLLTQFTFTPLAIDLARLSEQSAASISTGARILFNRNFLVLVTLSANRDQKSMQLTFGQDF